ncbi:MAG: putative peptidoglycan binding domain [Rhodobacteraceae bacterium HLUCCA08]|nr:MAG: putative peptidoglycan binding domain [Rhodobacteraceae bacterium HLUCCA08]
MTRFLVVMFTVLTLGTGVAAQDRVWVQIEAQRTLTGTQDAARGYEARGVPDVQGFALTTRWYAVVLGPYSPADAEAQLSGLRARGLIPADSYIVNGNLFTTQFWPVGLSGNADTRPVTVPEADPDPAITAPEPAPEPDPIQPPDETLAEARAAENALSRDEKREVQEWLQWAGFYTGALDGLYGRGTRQAMEAWQIANNHEPTGVMTTGQRGQLRTAYNAILDGMDLQVVRDNATGIEIAIPTGVVDFTEYRPPFANFEPRTDLGARVLLISQPGDRTRLAGLYEILQTLEIVPPEGPRDRSGDSFVIEGIGRDIHTHVTARHADGQIKGFALIWPTGDEDRRARVLSEMQASFTSIAGVLDPGIVAPDEDQAIDLVSGLAIRKPLRDRSGFFIDADGDVLTTLEAVDGCGEVTLDSVHPARVIHRDDRLGLVVLRPEAALAPPAVAAFQTGVPRLQSEIAVAGYPYGGVLPAPALTFGTLADIRGLNGEDEVKRLVLTAQEGDAGGPVFDNGGAVLGMLLPRQTLNGQVLPPDVAFSVDASEIVASVQGAGLSVQTTATLAYMTPEAMSGLANDVTVLVSCWE